MSTQQEQQNHIEELNNELTIRREKLAAIREQGIAFPNDFRRDAISSDLHKLYDDKTDRKSVV